MKMNAETCRDRPGRTVFLSGVHGVGKTTLCNAVARQARINTVSSSSLLDEQGGRWAQDGGQDNKTASECICQRLEKLLVAPIFLLVDGHCTLAEGKGNISVVDKEIFRRIRVQGFILLIDDVEVIQKRIFKRDGMSVDRSFIGKLQDAELRYSAVLSIMLGVKREIIDLSVCSFVEAERKIVTFIESINAQYP
ncbi:MAG: AAA family ATPase [Desulfurivibrionaceae bacterium]